MACRSVALSSARPVPQRDHHAQEGAEHAQQDQQADQVGRERGARQGGALAFDAQPGGVAQAGRQESSQPASEAGGASSPATAWRSPLVARP